MSGNLVGCTLYCASLNTFNTKVPRCWLRYPKFTAVTQVSSSEHQIEGVSTSRISKVSAVTSKKSKHVVCLCYDIGYIRRPFQVTSYYYAKILLRSCRSYPFLIWGSFHIHRRDPLAGRWESVRSLRVLASLKKTHCDCFLVVSSF